jgi:hypothetical protein
MRAGHDSAPFLSSDAQSIQVGLLILSDAQTFVFLWVSEPFIFGSPASCDQFTASILSLFDRRVLGEAKWLLGVAFTSDEFYKRQIKPVGHDPHNSARKKMIGQLHGLNSVSIISVQIGQDGARFSRIE